MHTDKSEWTFIIALSEGRGRDYECGGTYIEVIDSTIHLQRGKPSGSTVEIMVFSFITYYQYLKH